MRTRTLVAALPLVAAGLACSSSPATSGSSTPDPSRATTPASSSSASSSPTESPAPTISTRATPKLKVTRAVTGLDIPWDVQQLPDGALLVTERDRARLSIVRGGKVRSLGYPSELVWVSGETGLMSMAVDPSYESNRRIYTCQGFIGSGARDVRVIAWKVNAKQTRVKKPQVLLSGLPTTSGRHGGCRLLIDDSGALHVGTGDAAVGTNPRDLTSLGGKTLALDRMTGEPWKANPFINAENRNQRYVTSYGHRNVQGLAQRGDGTIWSVEHGSYRDDEVNLIEDGGDYGWNPVPGYNEAVPMTDPSLPGRQIEARWSSGNPTIATSGAAWVHGKQWGRYNGTLAVAALAGNRVVFMKFDRAGVLQWTRTPPALRAFGRLRSVTSAANGDLLITTGNGGGSDGVLRVRPQS